MAIFNTVYGGEKKVWNGDLSKVNESTKISTTITPASGWVGYGFRLNSEGTLATFSFSNKAIKQYPLSTAWDITTIGSDTYTLSTSNSYPFCIFSRDGTKAIIRYGGNSTFYVFNLSTAWDLSTKDSGTSYNMGGDYPTPYDISPDGKTFVYNKGSNRYPAYSVSNSAYVLNTSGTQLLDISQSYDGIMSNDGKYFYTTSGNSKILYRYKLDTAWDFTTFNSTADQSVTLSISGNLAGIGFDTYGDNMFILGQGNGTQYLYKYSLA